MGSYEEKFFNKYRKQEEERYKALKEYEKRKKAQKPKEIPVKEKSQKRETYNPKPRRPKTLPHATKKYNGKFIAQALNTGITGLNKGLAETADWLLPDQLTPKFVQKGLDYYKNEGNRQAKKLEKMQTTTGRKVVGGLLSGTVQALPNAGLALMTGGASLGAQSAKLGVQTGAKALTASAAKTMKNPAFWTSFAQTAGPTYEKEKAEGASDLRASLSAMTNAFVGSAIEMGGGIENFTPSRSGAKNILRTALEEGGEEIKQYATENLINKAIGSNTAKWVSLEPSEDAVINPAAAAIQGAYGAGIGAIMGGGQQALYGAASSMRGAKSLSKTNTALPSIPESQSKPPKMSETPISSELETKIFNAVEKRSQAKIVRTNLPEGIDGYYKDGIMTISNTAKNPAFVALKHELTHNIERSGYYQELSDFIENGMRTSGYDVDGELNRIIKDYQMVGQNLTTEQAKKEFVAKFSEEFLFNSEKSIERLARENPNVFQRVYDWIVDTIHKIGASEETKFLIDAQRKYERALRTVGKVQSNGVQMSYIGKNADIIETYRSSEPQNGTDVKGEKESEVKEYTLNKNVRTDANGKPRYWLNPNFSSQLDNWYGNEKEFNKTGGFFLVGKTSPVLKSIGVNTQDIVWDKSKIKKIMQEHSEMTKDVIKQVPNMLEDPIIVLQSKTRLNSIVVFGEVYDADGNAVMAALLLKPEGKDGRILGYSKITSAYRRKNAQNLIDDSEVLYVCPNKNRTDDWSRACGLRLPVGLTSRGSIGRVTYYNDAVNDKNQPDENHILSAHGNVGIKKEPTAMEIAFRKAEENKEQLSLSQTALTATDYTKKLSRTSRHLYGEQGNKYAELFGAEMQAEPVQKQKSPKGVVKAKKYERRKINELKQDLKDALGINKYADNNKANMLINDAVEKLKNGSLGEKEKTELFDALFEEGVIVDTTMIDRYADLKQTLKNTQLKVNDDIRNNITDFTDFRRNALNKVRLSDSEGVAVDSFYMELQEIYPELFPNVNTTAEMVEIMADIAESIHETQTHLENAFGFDIDEYRLTARAKFDIALDKMTKQLNIVSRYMKERSAVSSDEAIELAGNVKKIEREVEKIKQNVILDAEDNFLVESLLKGRIPPENIANYTINADNVLTVYEAEKTLQNARQGLRELRDAKKEEYRFVSDVIVRGSERWKDKKGLFMMRETPERVMYDVAGKEKGKQIVDEYIRPIHENEALSNKMKQALRDAVKQLKISTEAVYIVDPDNIEAPGLKESHYKEIKSMGKMRLSEAELTQLYGENLIDESFLNSVNANPAKIKKSVDTMRQIYNQLIDAANEVLLIHGYEPIEYRKNYFPHFSENKPDGVLAKLADKLGIAITKDELPTSISGLTHTFRPGKKWFGNALSRTGKSTEYDALKGFDIYLEGIADVIHHTEDIQKLRSLENSLRTYYTDDKAKEEINEVEEGYQAGNISRAQRNVLVDELLKRDMSHLGSFATWLRNYTDSLAGKKSLSDRTTEHALGRTFYNTTKAIENRVAANMVALNPASWLTNFIPLVQAGEIKTSNIIKGMAQTVQSSVKDDNFKDFSTFLTNRRGSDVLWKSNTEKLQDIITAPMQWIDNFTSESLVRAKYLEEIENGKSDSEAMKIADETAASVIADRSKGALPTVFNSKNPLIKILTMYQVEVNNQWSHLLKDIPRTQGNVMKVALAYAKFAVFAYLFNDIYEYFIGRRPALDPISWANDFMGDWEGKKVPNFVDAIVNDAGFEVEKKTGGAAVANLGKNIAQDIPFFGGLLEGGRVPVSSALPSASKLATAGGNLISGDIAPEKAGKVIGKELAKPLTYVALPFGGGQLKKVAESAGVYANGGSYDLNNKGQKELQFAADPNGKNLVKGILFGKYAMGNAKDYVDSGFKRLNVKKTEAYDAAVKAGVKPEEAEKFIRSLNTQEKGQMRNAIMNSNFTKEQKNAIGLPLETEKEIDYSSKANFAKSQMTDKQKEKVDALIETGLTTKEAMKAYNTYKDIDGSKTTKAIDMLAQEAYTNKALKALGITAKTANKARKMAEVGITGVQYERARLDANTGGSSYISRDEAIAYLEARDYNRRQKYLLLKALVPAIKDKNNPYS